MCQYFHPTLDLHRQTLGEHVLDQRRWSPFLLQPSNWERWERGVCLLKSHPHQWGAVVWRQSGSSTPCRQTDLCSHWLRHRRWHSHKRQSVSYLRPGPGRLWSSCWRWVQLWRSKPDRGHWDRGNKNVVQLKGGDVIQPWCFSSNTHTDTHVQCGSETRTLLWPRRF